MLHIAKIKTERASMWPKYERRRRRAKKRLLAVNKSLHKALLLLMWKESHMAPELSTRGKVQNSAINNSRTKLETLNAFFSKHGFQSR